MSDLSQVPALKKGGDRIAATTTAIVGAMVDAFLPAAGTAFAQACGYLINARMEKASEILISEIQSGNLDVLSEEKYRAFIPMGYRFYEAARQGENVFILKKLAKIIKNGISDSLEPDRFLKISKSIEGLDERDLAILAEYVKSTIDFRNRDQNNFNLFFSGEEKRISDTYKIEIGMISTACGVLAGRGLLISLANQGLGGGTNYFMASDFAIEIANLSTSFEQ